MVSIAPGQKPSDKTLCRLRRIAPYLLLGPITGLLALAIVHNFREGRPVLAGLCAIILVEVAFLMTYATAALSLKLL